MTAVVAAPIGAVSDAVPADRASVDDQTLEVLPGYDAWVTDQMDAGNSYDTIEHLVEEIGPRLNGTRQEREAAEYLGQQLESYGFTAEIQEWGPVSSKNVADIEAVGGLEELPGNPIWQMGASPAGLMTGPDSSVTGRVVDAGDGSSAEDFAQASGRIAYVTMPTSSPAVGNAVTLAQAAGAVAIIVTPPASSPRAPRGPELPAGQTATIPVLGGGSDHTGWLGEIAGGALQLRVSTSHYETPMGVNVIATRKAVTDPDSAPIVMVGAHIDSVLGAPGAHDDASGNGVALETARALSQLPYDKEIRIGGFGGEEAGLLGAREYVKTLTAQERERFVGEWQMDMVGTPYGPAGLWALTPDGRSNYVVDQAYEAADRAGFDGLDNCKLGQSDHQAFFDAGIPASLFIWLDYRKPADCVTGSAGYQTEPEYHMPSDTMENISQERLQHTLDVVGGAVAHNALNELEVTVEDGAGKPIQDAAVTVACDQDDQAHDGGTTDADGLTVTRAPAGSCEVVTQVRGTMLSQTVEMSGDEQVTLAMDAVAPVRSRIQLIDRKVSPRGPVKLRIHAGQLRPAQVAGRATVRFRGKQVGSAAVVRARAAIRVRLPKRNATVKVRIDYSGTKTVAPSRKVVRLKVRR